MSLCRAETRCSHRRHKCDDNLSCHFCCVEPPDKFASAKNDFLATTHDQLRSRQNHIDTACGKREFCKKLIQNGSNKADTSDTIYSHSSCDTHDAVTTSGLNDCRFPLCSENATSSTELETVAERIVEGRSEPDVVCREEALKTMIQFEPSSKRLPKTVNKHPQWVRCQS